MTFTPKLLKHNKIYIGLDIRVKKWEICETEIFNHSELNLPTKEARPLKISKI